MIFIKNNRNKNTLRYAYTLFVANRNRKPNDFSDKHLVDL